METALQELLYDIEKYIKVDWPMNKSIRNSISKALEKEKEQILKAHLNGQSEFDVLNYTEFNKDLAEEYYKQTYNK